MSKILRNKFNTLNTNLYSENYKTLLRKIKLMDLNEWREIPCEWIKFNIVKKTILLKLIYESLLKS